MWRFWHSWSARLASIASSAVVLLLSRWMFRLARPEDDLGRVKQWGVSVATHLCPRGLRRLWMRYSPITDPMRHAWLKLRTRYQAGAYGLEGT